VTDSLDTRGHHLLFLAPGAGLLVTLTAWARRDKGSAEREDLAGAARWQALGAAVVVLHGALQAAIEFTRWLERSGPGLGDPLTSLFPLMLKILTWLNVGGGAAEWLFLAGWAVAASRGRSYPVLLRSRHPGSHANG